MTWVINYSPYKGTTYAIHLMIANVVNSGHSNHFYMRQGKLARKARTSRKTVNEAIQKMVEDGCLRLHKDRTRSGKDDANVYQFLMPEVDRVFDSGTKSGVPNDSPQSQDSVYASAYRHNAKKRRAEADMARAGAPMIPGLLGDDEEADADADVLSQANDKAATSPQGGSVAVFAIDEDAEDDALVAYVPGPAVEGVTTGDTNGAEGPNDEGVTKGDTNIGVTNRHTGCNDSLHRGVTNRYTHIWNNPKGTPSLNPIFRGTADAAPRDGVAVTASSSFSGGPDQVVVADLRDSDRTTGREDDDMAEGHQPALEGMPDDPADLADAVATVVARLAAVAYPGEVDPSAPGEAPNARQAQAMTLDERLERLPREPLTDAPPKVRKDWATEVNRYFLDWRDANDAGPLNKSWIPVIRKNIGEMVEQGFAPHAALMIVLKWAGARRPDGVMYHPGALKTFANSAAQNGGAVHGSDGQDTAPRHAAVSEGMDGLAAFVRSLPNAAG